MAGVDELTVTEQLNVPVADTVAPQVETVAPELTEAVIVAPGVKPVPEIVTPTPLGPCAGARLMPGRVTLNDAVAASKLPSEPMAVIVYVAGVDEVTVTVQLNVPEPETVALQAPIDAPLPMEAVIVTPGVNPVPEIVTAAPLGPWPGASVIPGRVTLNEAVAASKLPSDPVAVTV